MRAAFKQHQPELFLIQIGVMEECVFIGMEGFCVSTSVSAMLFQE